MMAITVMNPADHYRYEYIHDRSRLPRPPWLVQAVLNEGHHGFFMNCTHPHCAQLRSVDPWRAATTEPTP